MALSRGSIAEVSETFTMNERSADTPILLKKEESRSLLWLDDMYQRERRVCYATRYECKRVRAKHRISIGEWVSLSMTRGVTTI